jgi:hypothetical protein
MIGITDRRSENTMRFLIQLPDGRYAMLSHGADDSDAAAEKRSAASYRRSSVGFNAKDEHASSGDYSGDCRSIGFLKGRAA